MAIALLRAILSSDGDDLQFCIAKEYNKWYLSNPFDIGTTTHFSMRCIYKHLQKYSDQSCMNLLISEIHKTNSESLSNGCLMRATPMSVYLNMLSDEEIYSKTKLDVNLTHTNLTAVFAVACYNIAIAHLLNNLGDYKGAIDRVDHFVSNSNRDNISPEFFKIWNALQTTKSDRELIAADSMIGYLMIAFSHSFYFLKNNYSYEDALRQMLSKGGDTDTNAAIVGGLVGARWGLDGIPHEWVVNGIKFDNFRKNYTQLKDVNELEKMIELLLKKSDMITRK